MVDFSIEFISNKSINFTDPSDYTGLTVLSTSLKVFFPLIQNDSFETINLYSTTVVDLPIAVLGDDVVLDFTDTDENYTFNDGIYRFTYIVEVDGASDVVIEKYFKKDIDVLLCKKNIVKEIVANKYSDKCKACEATFFDSVLASIDTLLLNNEYKEAEELMSYLKAKCSLCNNC